MTPDPAFRRFLAAMTAPADLTVDQVMHEHGEAWMDRSAELADVGAFVQRDAYTAAALWGNRLCAALRSDSRLERMSAEMALRLVFHRLTGGAHGSHDA